MTPENIIETVLECVLAEIEIDQLVREKFSFLDREVEKKIIDIIILSRLSYFKEIKHSCNFYFLFLQRLERMKF